jgi:hypothetical protein
MTATVIPATTSAARSSFNLYFGSQERIGKTDEAKQKRELNGREKEGRIRAKSKVGCFA